MLQFSLILEMINPLHQFSLHVNVQFRQIRKLLLSLLEVDIAVSLLLDLFIAIAFKIKLQFFLLLTQAFAF